MHSTFNPLLQPLTLAEPGWPLRADGWQEHIPFAFFLLSALRPKVFLELSKQLGDSYLAFCQASQSLELAVTGQARFALPDGVEQAKRQAELRTYHDTHFSAFSQLCRRDFAQITVEPGTPSIDLLHIDSFRSYEAVQRDFQTWAPKVSQGGIVLLSNVGTDLRNRGVRQFWLEIQLQYPHFEFEHSGGLGVLAVGEVAAPALQAIFVTDDGAATAIRAFFARLGQRLSLAAQATARARQHASETLRWAEQRAESDRQVCALKQQLAESEEHRQAEHARLHGQLLAITGSRTWLLAEKFWRVRSKLKWNRQQAIEPALPPAASPPASQAKPVIAEEFVSAAQAPFAYPVWLAQNEPNFAELATQRTQARTFSYRPLISIVTPVYRTPPVVLRACVESVLEQTYDHWNLCLVEGGSNDPALREMLDDFARRDQRIKVQYLPENLGISENTNEGLRLAAGEFIALLDHDDALAPNALFEYVQRLNEDPTIEIFYSDEDKLDHQGNRCDPFFKPDWSPEYFRGVMYVGHLLCFRRHLLEQTGLCQKRFDGVQDFELMLRLSEVATNIIHVPKLLYHWRKSPNSVAENINAKPHLSELQCAAVNVHLTRLRLPASAEIASPYHQLRIAPLPMAEPPLVSLLVAHAGGAERLAACLQSLYLKTHYANYEVIVVGSHTALAGQPALAEQHALRSCAMPGSFSPARAYNLAAQQARGEHLVFLSSELEVVTPDWLTQLVYYAAQPDVAAAGPLLLNPARRVWHAGYGLSAQGANAILQGADPAGGGYAGTLVCAREVSALSGACLCVKRSRFQELGGFNEYFRQAFYDVDFCLRLTGTRQRIVFTPRAELIQHAATAATSGDYQIDQTLFLDLWQTELESGDPYFNPAFDAHMADYSLRGAGLTTD